jgi:hypothetical protein
MSYEKCSAIFAARAAADKKRSDAIDARRDSLAKFERAADDARLHLLSAAGGGTAIGLLSILAGAAPWFAIATWGAALIADSLSYKPLVEAAGNMKAADEALKAAEKAYEDAFSRYARCKFHSVCACGN